MAQLSYDQIYALARYAGATPDQAVTLTAIAEPESNRDPTSQNLVDNFGRQSSFGLWQISTGTHTPPDPNWADPFVNARLALGKLKTQGFRAWGTYNTNKYQQFLGEARAAQRRVEGPRGNYAAVLASIPGGGKNPIQRGIDAAKSIPGKVASAVASPVVDALGSFQKETKKVAFIGLFAAAGIGLVVVGLVQFVSPQIKQTVKRAATTAATKGAA